MIKKAISQLETMLKLWQESIPPTGRMLIVLVMFLLFASGSIYMTASAFCNLGKPNSKSQMQIKHIKSPEPQFKQEADSIKPLNDFNYE